MKELTINELQLNISEWIAAVGSTHFDPLTNGCMLSEEAGEVNRLLCREYGQQQYKPSESVSSFKMTLADELADVLFVLGCIANEQGIDLSKAIRSNLIKKATRDATRYRSDTTKATQAHVS